MPQKGQITKHEWKMTLELDDIGIRFYQCIHCPCSKREKNIPNDYADIEYTNKTGHKTANQPRCITRKIQADGE